MQLRRKEQSKRPDAQAEFKDVVKLNPDSLKTLLVLIYNGNQESLTIAPTQASTDDSRPDCRYTVVRPASPMKRLSSVSPSRLTICESTTSCMAICARMPMAVSTGAYSTGFSNTYETQIHLLHMTPVLDGTMWRMLLSCLNTYGIPAPGRAMRQQLSKRSFLRCRPKR